MKPRTLKPYIKKCEACGIEIEARTCKKQFCAKCKAERNKTFARINRQREREIAAAEKAMRKRNKARNDIEKIAQEARAAGLSYGQYVAQMHEEAEKERKRRAKEK